MIPRLNEYYETPSVLTLIVWTRGKEVSLLVTVSELELET